MSDENEEKAEEKKIEVINVTSAELWTAAADVRQEVSIKSVEGSFTFDVRALSYAEDQKIMKDYPNPEVPEVQRGRMVVRNYEDEKYLDACAEQRFKRMVASIDLCWDVIPGDSIDEKSKWAQENIWRGGDMKNLYSQIMAVSGFGAGAKKDEDCLGVKIKKASDWVKASRAPSVYKFTRGKAETHFNVTGIKGTTVKQIETSTNPGPAPLEFQTGPLGVDKKAPKIPNPKDPKYVQRCEELSEARRVLWLDEALGFKIPGDTMEDKVKWLGARPTGEVNELVGFLSTDIMSYRDRVDFTSGL